MLEKEPRLKGVDFSRKGNFCVRNTKEEVEWWRIWCIKIKAAAHDFTERDLRWNENEGE